MFTETYKKGITAYLVIVILLDFMGVATVVTLFPNLLLGAHSIFPTAWSDPSKLAAMGVMLAIYPLGQFFGASLLGKLSDNYGRKKMMLFTLIGTCIGFLFSALAVDLAAPILLFVSRLLAGLCAGNVAIAQASLIDISENEVERTRNISYGQMAMGSAYIVGPVLGAWLSQSSLISWFNPSTPFWFFTLILAVLAFVTIVFYRKTLKEVKHESVNLLAGLKQIYEAFHDKKLKSAFAVWLVFVTGWWLFESYMPAYLLKGFHFNTMQIGTLLAFNGALYAGFQYLVVQRLAKKLSAKTMARISIWLAGLAIISIVTTSNVLYLYLAMIVFVIAMGFAIPGLITHISNLANKESQGQAMGMVGSIQALSTVMVMLVGGYLDGINIAITVVAGGLLVIASWVLFIKAFGLKESSSSSVALGEEA